MYTGETCIEYTSSVSKNGLAISLTEIGVATLYNDTNEQLEHITYLQDHWEYVSLLSMIKS